jgi:hypothetical protein
MDFIIQPERRISARHYDVVVAGGGTSGVFAALAAARSGAKTALIERKGYVGGIATEGGCGLHSFFNLWRAFPGVEKRMVVRGIPEEFIQRLYRARGCSGHNDTLLNYQYDSDTLCVDVEVYKFIALEMLREAGVHVMLNTWVADALQESGRITGVIAESHQGREAVMGSVFVDATGFGDLCARAGARYTDPNDYEVVNSMGVGGIDIDRYFEFLRDTGSLTEYGRGPRSGRENQIIRVDGYWKNISPELYAAAGAIPHRRRRAFRRRVRAQAPPDEIHRAHPQNDTGRGKRVHCPHRPVAHDTPGTLHRVRIRPHKRRGGQLRPFRRRSLFIRVP